MVLLFLLLALALTKDDDEDQKKKTGQDKTAANAKQEKSRKKMECLNNVTVWLFVIIMLLDVVLSGFGFKSP